MANKTQRAHTTYMMDAMRRLEWELHNTVALQGRIPGTWHEIARDRGAGRKTRITLRVEAEVVRFFKSMGEGYQAKMNDVLAAWMHGRLAGFIEGPETLDIFKRDWAEQEPKPDWGVTGRATKRKE
ncbi:MAG: BrnA antitoxin family protein [Paracoccaceae bacterium]